MGVIFPILNTVWLWPPTQQNLVQRTRWSHSRNNIYKYDQFKINEGITVQSFSYICSHQMLQHSLSCFIINTIHKHVFAWNNMKQTTNSKKITNMHNKISTRYLDYLLRASSSLDDSLSFFCLMCFLLLPLSLLFFFTFCFSLPASPSLSLSSSNV